MAGAAGWLVTRPTSGRAGRARWHSGVAGSPVLCRLDRRERKRDLVRAKKHGTKSGSDAPFRRGFVVPANGLRGSWWRGRV